MNEQIASSLFLLLACLPQAGNDGMPTSARHCEHSDAICCLIVRLPRSLRSLARLQQAGNDALVNLCCNEIITQTGVSSCATTQIFDAVCCILYVLEFQDKL